MTRYRAFISYSHDDQPALAAVRAALQACGLETRSSGDLAPGEGFTGQIQTFIAHSHVFVPILTPASHQRGWVHQEIGFAVALRVPVVPVCIGRLPGGMIEALHGIELDSVDSDLSRRITRTVFDEAVADAMRRAAPLSEIASEVEDRAVLLERMADDAVRFTGRHQPVRQAGGFSSFSLPDEPPGHVSWVARWGNEPRGPYALDLLRRERRALQAHARRAGCRLIVNLGVNTDRHYGVGSRHARLSVLLDFLQELAGGKRKPGQVQVVLVDRYAPESMIAVGDWFVAESRSGRLGSGYPHTTFTAHAPSVARRIERFDEELAGLLKARKVAPAASLDVAIERLRSEVAGAERHPDWPQ